jgi:hypothetical protein
VHSLPISAAERLARVADMRPSNRVWKATGIAGLIGVVATGVLVARNERERRAYTPDEVRDRLHQRLRDAGHIDAADLDTRLSHERPGFTAPAAGED